MTIKEPWDQRQLPIRTHSGSSGMAPDRSGASKDDQKVAAATGTCFTLLCGECSTAESLLLHLCQLGNRETGTGLLFPDWAHSMPHLHTRTSPSRARLAVHKMTHIGFFATLFFIAAVLPLGKFLVGEQARCCSSRRKTQGFLVTCQSQMPR